MVITPKGNIAVALDDSQWRGPLGDFLKKEGYAVTHFPSAGEALGALREGAGCAIDVLVADLKADLPELKEARPAFALILTSPVATIDSSLEAMQKGAHFFLGGPIRLTELRAVLERAMEWRRLFQENEELRAQLAKTADPIDLTHDLPTLSEMERRFIGVVLEKTGGQKSKAAEILGINRRTLYRKEREYGWVRDGGEGNAVPRKDSSLQSAA